jgi:uncharacterized SAM-binding protein YcdF (DUF218 family)
MGLVAPAGGFALFLRHLDRAPAAPPRSDGIIVLTGGPERISEAVEHLAAGHAGRLLITGVHAATSGSRIADLTPLARTYLECCIDLDHRARNTVENAAEAARWMRSKGFRSALVVTADYHMPRAMVELARHIPEARLTPAPVVTEHLSLGRLWREPPLLRVVGVEYAKFLVASARAGLTGRPPSDDIAQLDGRRGS